MRIVMNKLAESILQLCAEKAKDRAQRQTEFEWLRSHADLATTKDLKGMEKRLTDALAWTPQITPALEAAALRLSCALDTLDAAIPDKPKETVV